VSDPLSDTPDPSPTPSEDTGKQTRGLQEALTAERARRQEMEARLASFEAAQKKRDEDEARKRGEFEQLYTAASAREAQLTAELDTYKAREAARVEAVTAENAARLERLPENFRALVPDGLDPDAARQQIARLESVLTTNTPTGGIPPRTVKPSEEKIPEQAIREAERLGYTDPRKYFEGVWKRRQQNKKG
jgi:predicted phage gp36 major capsid-like protein